MGKLTHFGNFIKWLNRPLHAWLIGLHALGKLTYRDIFLSGETEP